MLTNAETNFIITTVDKLSIAVSHHNFKESLPQASQFPTLTVGWNIYTCIELKLVLLPKTWKSDRVSGLMKICFVGLQKWVVLILSKSVQATMSDKFVA